MDQVRPSGMLMVYKARHVTDPDGDARWRITTASQFLDNSLTTSQVTRHGIAEVCQLRTLEG